MRVTSIYPTLPTGQRHTMTPRGPTSAEILLAARDAFDFISVRGQTPPTTYEIRQHLLARKHEPMAVMRALRQIAIMPVTKETV